MDKETLQQIAELAKEKGFKPQTKLSKNIFVCIINKWTVKETESYLWLCEIQKWLRDVHKIFIEVKKGYNPENFYNIIELVESKISLDHRHNPNNWKGSYEQALALGILESLKLI